MPAATTTPPPTSTNGSGLPDVEFLRAFRWIDAAPRRLAAAARRGDAPEFSREIRRDLRRRFGTKSDGLDRLVARFPLGEAPAREEYLSFDGETPPPPSDRTNSLLRTAARFDGLRRLGGSANSARLWPIWRDLWTASKEAVPVDASPLDSVFAAEISWASGIVFSGVAGMRARLKNARAKLFAEFDARTDTDGTPHAELLPVLPAWFASLVRTATWAKSADLRLWDAAYSGRFDGLVRTVAALTRPDGRLLLGGEADLRPILGEAIKRSRWKLASPVSKLAGRLERQETSAAPTRESLPRKSDRKFRATVQSDWAKLVLSRSRWRPQADAVAIAHHRERPSIEFLAFGRSVFAGEWGLRVKIDGRELSLSPDWEAVSWFSDGEADYLELQWPNEQGATLCRQMLLTRGDHQLLLADSVSTPGRPDARIEVEASLPLAPSVSAEILRPSRELRLDAAGLRVRAFPVALPTERIESGPGRFEAETGSLSVRGFGPGGVYLPIVFDWHPKRREAFADWRTLTVTENHRRLGPAEASGHRLRVGTRQLLVYRRMNESKAMRAVLGYHHASESVVGRFNADGDVEPLVLVE